MTELGKTPRFTGTSEKQRNKDQLSQVIEKWGEKEEANETQLNRTEPNQTKLNEAKQADGQTDRQTVGRPASKQQRDNETMRLRDCETARQ